VFDRFIQIWLENTDFATAAASSVYQELSAQGITLTGYYALTHPSEPNYLASVGGDFWGLASDDFVTIPANISTVVDLLELEGISWAEYMENMPTDGYQGYNFTNSDGYTYYVRKHNPLIVYDSVSQNPARAARIRNFNDFAYDVRQLLFCAVGVDLLSTLTGRKQHITTMVLRHAQHEKVSGSLCAMSHWPDIDNPAMATIPMSITRHSG